MRVTERHRIEERRGLVGTIVARYGAGEYVAVDVRLVDGRYRMFRPGDLDEIPTTPRAWRSFLFGWGASG